MSDWRKEHIENRENMLKGRIRKIEDDFEKNEAVIRKIDSEDMMLHGLPSSDVVAGGRLVPTRGFFISVFDDIIRVRAGASGINKDNEIAYSELIGNDDVLSAKVEEEGGSRKLALTFKGEHALEKAATAFNGMALILEGFKKEYEERLAKAKESQSNE